MVSKVRRMLCNRTLQRVFGIGFMTLSLVLGVASVAHADNYYRLPWSYCSWQSVIQGWGGSYSHYGTQMWYAYDFNHSIGTPVVVSRSGVVSYVQSGMTECGGPELANEANYVTVSHSDGKATLYLHLDQVFVSNGQYVTQGTTIGTGGDTGWTRCDPHLHFQRQDQGGWIMDSAPIYFDEYPGQQLAVGQWYMSENGYGPHNCPNMIVPEPGPVSSLMMFVLGLGLVIMPGARRRRRLPASQGGMLLSIALVGVLLAGCQPEAASPALENPRSRPGLQLVVPDSSAPVRVSGPNNGATPQEREDADLPPPAPAVWPDARPIVLITADDLDAATTGWVEAEREGWVVSHPPEYSADESSVKEDAGISRAYVPVARWTEWSTGSDTRRVRDDFVTLFVWRDPSMTAISSSDELRTWLAALPDRLNPIGGQFEVGEKMSVDGKPAWSIQWESMPDLFPPLESIIIVDLGRVTMVNLDSESPDRWDQQMAFLAGMRSSAPGD